MKSNNWNWQADSSGFRQPEEMWPLAGQAGAQCSYSQLGWAGAFKCERAMAPGTPEVWSRANYSSVAVGLLTEAERPMGQFKGRQDKVLL